MGLKLPGGRGKALYYYSESSTLTSGMSPCSFITKKTLPALQFCFIFPSSNQTTNFISYGYYHLIIVDFIKKTIY